MDSVYHCSIHRISALRMERDVMNEKEIRLMALAENMWPFDARVFARWVIKTELSTDRYYLLDWLERFRKMRALSKMDLRRIRDYAQAIIEIEEEWS